MRTVRNILIISVASVLYGIGVGSFLDPNNLAPGGVTGIAIIINRISGIETGTMAFVLNIPLIIIGVWKFGFRFLISTIYAIFLTSYFINIFEMFPKATSDLLLSALAGGVLVAVSVGMIFIAGATTGGTDIVVRIIKLKYRHMKTGVVFMITDMIIVAASAVIFRKIDIALYALISVVTCSIVLDMVLYGKDEAKIIYIISKNGVKEKAIVDGFLRNLGVGVTYLEGYGAFRNSHKKVILCAIRKHQLPKAKEIIKDNDDEAFVIISSANEILGEGYKSHYSESQ